MTTVVQVSAISLPLAHESYVQVGPVGYKFFYWITNAVAGIGSPTLLVWRTSC